MTKISIEITDNLNLERAMDMMACPRIGGTNLFVGTVRDLTDGQQVQQLTFEAYESMAIREMRHIAEEVSDAYGLEASVIWHALGVKNVSERVVIVGAAAKHRDEAFKACRNMIDLLKVRVPIWKKEHLLDGEIWVNAHP